MEEKEAKCFLDGLIEKESCLIERLFFQNNMPDNYVTHTILKINVSRFFQYPQVTCGDRIGWSGNLWYNKDFLGGWIYELREKGMDNKEIYDSIINAKSNFLIEQRGKYSYHKVYDAMIEGLKNKTNLL